MRQNQSATSFLICYYVTQSMFKSEWHKSHEHFNVKLFGGTIQQFDMTVILINLLMYFTNGNIRRLDY